MADPTPPSPAKDDESDGGDEDILKVDLLATLDDALAYIQQSFPQDDEAGKVRARDAALRVADDILGGDPAGRDLMDDAVKEVHWIHQDGLDRYFLVYHDDRVAYVQVPADDWMTTDLMNKNGLKVFEITEEGRAFLAENRAAVDGVMERMALAARAMTGEAPPEVIFEAMHTLKAALRFHGAGWDDAETERVRAILVRAAKDIEDGGIEDEGGTR